MFIKVNAPKEAWEAWTSTDDDGAGLLVKAGALREQAREALVSAAGFITSLLLQPSLASAISTSLCVLDQTTVADTRLPSFRQTCRLRPPKCSRTPCNRNQPLQPRGVNIAENDLALHKSFCQVSQCNARG